MELCVFQETKLTKCIYTHEYSGYRVLLREAPSTHSGIVSVVYIVAEHFSIEALYT